MNACRSFRLLFSAVFLLGSLPHPAPLLADPIPVRHTQGATRGFLSLRSETGTIIATGDLVQLAQGDRVTSRLTFRFHDGSFDDETTIFTQRRIFQLVSDHHIQRGPFFSKPVDVLVEANGQITSRSIDKDGKQKVEVNHVDLGNDCSNGFLSTLLINVTHNTPPFKLGYLVASGKGRLIHLAISPDATGSFSISGIRRTASIFRVHPELGGVAGVVAPIIGKQPDDILVWILEGEAPAFLRSVGQLADGGPIVSIELIGTTFVPVAKAK